VHKSLFLFFFASLKALPVLSFSRHLSKALTDKGFSVSLEVKSKNMFVSNGLKPLSHAVFMLFEKIFYL
jgi:hypothetical protein